MAKNSQMKTTLAGHDAVLISKLQSKEDDFYQRKQCGEGCLPPAAYRTKRRMGLRTKLAKGPTIGILDTTGKPALMGITTPTPLRVLLLPVLAPQLPKLSRVGCRASCLCTPLIVLLFSPTKGKPNDKEEEDEEEVAEGEDGEGDDEQQQRRLKDGEVKHEGE